MLCFQGELTCHLRCLLKQNLYSEQWNLCSVSNLCRDPGIYRLSSPYDFPDKGSRTDKWLYVQRGTSPRFMPMTLVSNHGITEDEFHSWRTQCDKDNRPQVSIAEVDEVKERLHKAHT